MINVFFDCEFTKLQQPLDPEPNELISIGCISEAGDKFYAENSSQQQVQDLLQIQDIQKGLQQSVQALN